MSLPPNYGFSLDAAQASIYARLALKGVRREYPNGIAHLLNSEADVQSPRELHPAFYGCYDWHSAVHGHWLLARLLRLFPDLPESDEARAALDENLTEEKIKTETAYFTQPGRQSFERTYGWAWLLKLDEELGLAASVEAHNWRRALAPLTEVIVARYLDFLPKQSYPIRTGVHPNTAFGLAFALDYARATRHRELDRTVFERSKTYFMNDVDYPAHWEPGGEDFFSPALIEADLMRRVLQPDEFAQWFDRFLPGIGNSGHSLLRAVDAFDRTDPKLVHLDGLNLSRAWCLMSIAGALPQRHPARSALEDSALHHAQVGLQQVSSGDYLGEHWLATFAVYLLT